MGLDSIDNACGEGERSSDIHGLQMKKPGVCECRAEESLKSAPRRAG